MAFLHGSSKEIIILPLWIRNIPRLYIHLLVSPKICVNLTLKYDQTTLQPRYNSIFVIIIKIIVP